MPDESLLTELSGTQFRVVHHAELHLELAFLVSLQQFLVAGFVGVQVPHVKLVFRLGVDQYRTLAQGDGDALLVAEDRPYLNHPGEVLGKPKHLRLNPTDGSVAPDGLLPLAPFVFEVQKLNVIYFNQVADGGAVDVVHPHVGKVATLNSFSGLLVQQVDLAVGEKRLCASLNLGSAFQDFR